jgi:membrane fusion protein (multidrug efflux system)
MRIVRTTLAALVVLAGVACSRSEAGEQVEAKAEEAERSLPTIAVEMHAMPRELVLTGTLLADRQSDLAANANGKVLATFVERGQKVAAGDVIARLDARLAQYSAKAAAAQSKVAKAHLDLASLECERADKLLASGTISRTEYDTTKSQCASSKSSVAAAASQAALASVQAGDSVVKAPFAGIVGERFIDVGEYVLPSTRVVSLFSVDPIRVSIAVPEAEVGQIAVGQTVKFSVSGLGERVFEAEVKYLSPALREATRDLVVEAVAPNPDGTLRPGMFATVHLATADVRVLAAPAGAIVREDSRAMVWVVREGRAVAQYVRTGSTKDDKVSILAGLAEGDLIVLDPPEDLADGTKIAAQGGALAKATPIAAGTNP